MKTINPARDFKISSPPANSDGFFNFAYRRAICRAYSLSAAMNGWASCRFHVQDHVVYLETFKPNGAHHRAIAMWKDRKRDNEGYLFSVHTFGRPTPFRTNNLRHALGNFKAPKPQLASVPA